MMPPAVGSVWVRRNHLNKGRRVRVVRVKRNGGGWNVIYRWLEEPETRLWYEEIWGGSFYRIFMTPEDFKADQA